jgi:glutathione S-transferase
MTKHTAPRPYRLITARVSQGCELARWLLERAQLPCVEEPHVPVLHLLATRAVNGGNEVPVVVTPDGVWQSTMLILDAIDSHAPAGKRVFGETADEIAENRAFMARFLPTVGAHLRRYVYYQVLPYKSVMYPVATAGAPWWERMVVFWFYPLWAWLVGWALGIKAAEMDEAARLIVGAFDLVDAEIARRGTPWLSGDAPGGIDIVVSALLTPVIFPPQFGGDLPPLEAVTPTLRSLILAMRARPAGQLALKTYTTVRRSA